MTDRPILFSAPMVRAILAGTKTQTRRVMSVQPDEDASVTVEHFHQTVVDRHGEEQPGPEVFGAWWHDGERGLKCPYGQPGDRLWVRETWYCDDYRVQSGPYLQPDDMNLDEARSDGTLIYRASSGDRPYEAEQPVWRPAIHMPRWASRITLEITGVRVERLQDISEADALAEGVSVESVAAYRRSPVRDSRPAGYAFRDLWMDINGGASWSANPWVWVVEFKQIQAPGAAQEERNA